MPNPVEIASIQPGFDRPDLVVHLAANAKVHELVKDPRRAHENTTITFHVLEYCRSQNLPSFLAVPGRYMAARPATGG